MNDWRDLSIQVIKRVTDGGADYSFECIGDTGMITTALQSCCDVISISHLCFINKFSKSELGLQYFFWCLP